MANFLDFGPNFMDTISIFNKLTIKKANKKFRDGNIYYSENKNFRKSNKIFKSVEAKIPLASQTFLNHIFSFLIKMHHYLLLMEKEVIFGMLMETNTSIL